MSARLRAQFESDLLSFILFDGDFAEELISLGRHDAHERAYQDGGPVEYSTSSSG